MTELVDSTILESGMEFVLLSRIETEIIITKELDDEWVEKTFNQESKDSLNRMYEYYMTENTKQIQEHGNLDSEIRRLTDIVKLFNKDLINIFDRPKWSRKNVSNEIQDNQWVHTEPEEKISAEIGRLLIVHLIEDLKGEYITY